MIAVGRERLWPMVALFAVLATTSVLTNAPGQYVFDNRFDQYWNPGRRLSRYLVIWDGTRGLGRAREEFWPGATIPVAMMRWLGAEPWLAEHLWHATLLTCAGVGMVVLLRLFRPQIGLEHLAAGLLYMFGPFSATFLVPSNLYYHYALAPWLVVVTLRGVHSHRPWRWAAGFALLIFSVGNLDTPGLLYSGIPVVFALVYTVLVERSVQFRHVVAWLARAAVLCVPISMAALLKTYTGAGAYAQRLETTETPEAIASASSWSESVRGLGLWLSYFRDSGGLNRPHGVDFFSNPIVMIATFGVVLIAVAALWRVEQRDRLLFGGLLAIGTLLMVGAYPPGSPSPYGRILLVVQENVPGLSAIRASYKAGAGYAMGVSVLFGLGVAASAAWARRHRTVRRSPFLRALPTCGAFLVLLFAAWPFWTGNLYDPVKRLDDVPTYWTDAVEWLDAQPTDNRVLFAPGTTRSPYRWGWPGDDIHDALLDRPHAMDIAITLSNPYGTDILAAIDDTLSDGQYVPGTLAPVARRVGIEYIVLRNDVQWERTASPRPSDYTTLRADPDLELVATFGQPGENVIRPDDDTTLGREEATLPPVEVYRIRDAWPIVRAVPVSPPLLVSGNGEAWFPMADEGILDGINPIVYTASQSAEQLASNLEDGAGVVVTDTNRRRALAVQTYNSDLSWTLAADQQLERPADELFVDDAQLPVSGSQSVAWFPDAISIGDTGLFRPLGGFAEEYRPAAAFDGNAATAWIAPRFPHPNTRSLIIRFPEPVKLSAIELDGLETGELSPAQTDVYRAVVRFSNGRSVVVNTPVGEGTVEFPEVETTSVEIDLDAVPDGGSTGIAEIRFPGSDLDTTESLQVPDDLFRAAEASPELASALEEAPLTYLFSRETGERQDPVEVPLRRRFRTAGTRDFEVRGTLSFRAGGAFDSANASERGCTDVGLEIDGDPLLVELGADGVDPAGSDRVVAPFEACEPLSLEEGWHHLTSADGPTADRVVLSSGTLPSTSDDGSTSITTEADALADKTYRVDAPDGALLISGEAYGARWRATVDGEPLGPPIPADAQTAWVLPDGLDAAEVRVFHPDQKVLDIAVAVSVLTALGCFVLVLRGDRSANAVDASEGDHRDG